MLVTFCEKWLFCYLNGFWLSLCYFCESDQTPAEARKCFLVTQKGTFIALSESAEMELKVIQVLFSLWKHKINENRKTLSFHVVELTKSYVLLFFYTIKSITLRPMRGLRSPSLRLWARTTLSWFKTSWRTSVRSHKEARQPMSLSESWRSLISRFAENCFHLI